MTTRLSVTRRTIVDVTLRASDPVSVRPIVNPNAKEGRWSLWEVMSGPRYVAAVAVEGDGVRMAWYEWDASV